MKKIILENFRQFPIPDLLQKFYEILEANRNSGIDFELVDSDKALASYFKTDAKDNFIVLGQHGSDSLIVLWKLDHEHVDSMPVAWIDSEGSPICVLANDYTEFLTLIMYSTGTMYSILSSCISFIEDPNDCGNPRERFSSADLDQRIDELILKNEGYENLKVQLERVGIALSNDPVSVVENAIKNNPSLEKWIFEKEGW